MMRKRGQLKTPSSCEKTRLIKEKVYFTMNKDLQVKVYLKVTLIELFVEG